jgi:hypothetical protein
MEHDFQEARARLVGQHQTSLHTATETYRAASADAMERQRENRATIAAWFEAVKEDPTHPDHQAIKEALAQADQPADLTTINVAFDQAVQRADDELRVGMMALAAERRAQEVRDAVPHRPVGWRDPEITTDTNEGEITDAQP